MGAARARNGPTVDSWKRPRPGVGGQVAAMAVALAISQGKRPPTGKKLSDDARKGDETVFFLERGARKDHETAFFLEWEGPGPNFTLGTGPSHLLFVEESGPWHSKRGRCRLAGAARARNPGVL